MGARRLPPQSCMPGGDDQEIHHEAHTALGHFQGSLSEEHHTATLQRHQHQKRETTVVLEPQV